MAKLPPIDLTDLLKLLKTEGRGELSLALLGKGTKGLEVMGEWNNVVKGLEEIIPKLAEGTEVSAIKASAMQLGRSAALLSSMASQVLSFVPGPVGMFFSFVNAIVCLCTIQFPLCVGCAFLELLGCIPGGKVAVKGGAKLAPKIEKILLKLLEENKPLREIVEKSKEIEETVKNFAKRVPKMPSNTPSVSANKKIAQAPEPKVGQKLDINYNSSKAELPYSILYKNDQPARRSILWNNMEIQMVGNPYANIYSHLW